MESVSCEHFGCFFHSNMWLVLVRTPQLGFWNCSFLDSSVRHLDLVIYLPMFLMSPIHQPPALASSASAASLAVSA